jgi:hypothetical protein
VLDIVEIPFQRHVPHRYQSENHLIDRSQRWGQRGKASWAQAEAALDGLDEPLWPNQDASWEFRYNRVDPKALAAIDNSLRLIRPQSLRISVGRRGGMFQNANKRIIKAYLSFAGTDYTLQVTDPQIEARFYAGPDRVEDMTGCILCISLSEIFEGYAYKLVAAVIEPPKES